MYYELNQTWTTRYWQNLFVNQRSIQINVSMAYQRKRKSNDKKIKKLKGIRWIFSNNWWCLSKFIILKTDRKRKLLIVFDDVIGNIEGNKILSPIVAELFLKGWKCNISLVFLSQFYFHVSKTIRLNAAQYFIMKISNKRELQQIASNHLFDTEVKDFMKLYKEYTKKIIFTLRSDNPLRFEKNLV